MKLNIFIPVIIFTFVFVGCEKNESQFDTNSLNTEVQTRSNKSLAQKVAKLNTHIQETSIIEDAILSFENSKGVAFDFSTAIEELPTSTKIGTIMFKSNAAANGNEYYMIFPQSDDSFGASVFMEHESTAKSQTYTFYSYDEQDLGGVVYSNNALTSQGSSGYIENCPPYLGEAYCIAADCVEATIEDMGAFEQLGCMALGPICAAGIAAGCGLAGIILSDW